MAPELKTTHPGQFGKVLQFIPLVYGFIHVTPPYRHKIILLSNVCPPKILYMAKLDPVYIIPLANIPYPAKLDPLLL
jgi:hypothetical protein